MNSAKIQLSAEELHLVTNDQIILTKNRIIQKVYELMGALSGEYHIKPGNVFSPEMLCAGPKISRGENYLGLPYVILDYPRYFTKEDILAVRTMFWWGNDFSITLHLKGQFKTTLQNVIFENEQLLKQPGWYIQVSGDEWQHHKTDATHLPLHNIQVDDRNKIREKLHFMKMAYYTPLQQWNEASQILLDNFLCITEAINK